MSVIAVKVTKDEIIVGADTAVSSGECGIHSQADMKLFLHDGIIAGLCGNAENAYLLKNFFRNVEWKYDESNEEITDEVIHYLYSKFAEQVDETAARLRAEDGYPYDSIIMVVRGKVFQVDGYAVREITNYTALGCGGVQAKAALYLGASVERALDVACVQDVHCEYPLYVYKVNKKTNDITLTVYEKGDTLPK